MNNIQLINKALQYISREWSNEQISLDKVANAAGFSLSYFDRLFAYNVGQPVMEYVRNYKLVHSAQMLRTTDISVIDIALELGYANPESYTRAFKEQYKIPPSEYREKHRNKKLMWKDLSTGSVIKQFETQVPDMKGVDADDAIDFMLTTNPMYHLYNAYMLTQTDNAVYTFDDDELSDFIIVDEYRPEEMILEVVCENPERRRKYLEIARKFSNVYVSFVCVPDFETPADDFGLLGYKKTIYDNFIYLKDEIDILQVDGYAVRSINENDRDLVVQLATMVDKSVPIANIFEQKFKFNNYTDVELIGLFYNNQLVGCAMPTIDSVRNFKISDVGSVVICEQYKTEQSVKLLWSAVIQFALQKNAKPINFSAKEDQKIIGSQASENIGYTLVSKKIVYTNTQR